MPRETSSYDDYAVCQPYRINRRTIPAFRVFDPYINTLPSIRESDKMRFEAIKELRYS